MATAPVPLWQKFVTANIPETPVWSQTQYKDSSSAEQSRKAVPGDGVYPLSKWSVKAMSPITLVMF